MALWNKLDTVASVPKYVNLAAYPAGTRLVLVDTNEAKVAANIAKGLNGPGWWLYRSYTDAATVVRYKTEKIVAFSNSVTAVVAGDVGTGVVDDDIVADV